MTLSRDGRRGVTVLVGVGLFVAVVLSVFLWKIYTKPNIGSNNCVYEDKRLLHRKVADQTVIAVDQSEALSPSHKRQVRELLLDYVANDNELPVRSRVMLYVFGKNDFVSSSAGQSLTPSADLCRPPSSGNAIYENQRKLDRTFRDGFMLPVYKAIDSSIELALGQQSPILETIQYISRTQDIKESVDNKHKKTLIIVSDLLQNTDAFSHYRPWTWDGFQQSTAPALKADLRGWTVRLVFLQRYGRDAGLQDQRHMDFWMRYFNDAGAKLERIDRVP